MARRKPKVGDMIGIPLSRQRWAYCQYIYADDRMGPLIQVFDLISDELLTDAGEIARARTLFPPVITGVFAAVSRGDWRVIGQGPIPDFTYPGFVSTMYDQNTGRARVWFLWDGSHDIRLGTRLPREHRDKEYLVVWNPPDVVERIETGVVPFPYGDLLKRGWFVPKKVGSHG